MIRRITLQNYMAHVHTVIEPAAGLTVLVGPNNCGKSAVVSALETLCNNATGAYMVRHDEKEAQVTIETDDDHTFVWKRRGKVVSYAIDGREIHRVGGAVPDDLHKLLRLPKVDAGENGDPFDIHFGSQKSPIFLLNEPESRAALFFASSSDAAILLEMQKRHRFKVKERKNDEKRLKAEIANLDLRIAVLEPLSVLVASLEKADAQYEELETLEGGIQRIYEEMGRLAAQITEHERISARYKCLDPLMPLPEIAETRHVEQDIAALVAAENERHLEKSRCFALEPMAGPPVQQDTSALSISIRSLAAENESCSHSRICSAVLKDLKLPPPMDDLDALGKMCLTLSLCQTTYRRLQKDTGCLAQLDTPPTITDVGDLEKTVRSLESSRLANEKCIWREHVLMGLSSPPNLSDVQPLAGLISAIDKASSELSRLEGLHSEASAEMRAYEATLRSADRSGLDLARRVVAGAGRGSRFKVLVATGFVGVAIIASITIFALIWFSPTTTTEDLGVVVRSDGKTKTPAEVQTQNSAPKLIDAKKGEPKNDETKKAEPKYNTLAQARNLRLKQVRQLLNDADIAITKGKHLDAVLGYGQAAVLYPDELAEAENPDTVRAKFTNALSLYQAEVERALLKASERKNGDK